MQNWWRSLMGPVHAVIGSDKRAKRAKQTRHRWRPTLEVLEDRCVPSTMSSITANFNGTAIPAGDTIWFNSSLAASGLSNSAPTTLHIVNGTVTFTAGSSTYNIAVPNCEMVFTPGQTTASASFDPTDGDWDISVPTGGTGQVFATGVAFPVGTSLPGGIKNVTWSAGFWSDTPNVSVNWNFAAAVYSNLSTDPNALNVKPVDNNSLSVFHNGDKSATPEAFKSFVIGGGTGGGGTNYTGNDTGNVSVKPSLGDGVQDYPYASSNPLTSVAFNESSVLKAANLDTTAGFFQLWYSDEHALALGVRQVNGVNYPVASLTSNPGSMSNPATGATQAQGGVDTSGRPIAPSLYITDTTSNANNRSGDWQFGGQAYSPSDVFGTWKAAVATTSSTGTTVVCDVDPAKNSWNLGAGADPAPAGAQNEGYGAEVRWSLADLQAAHVLIPGHTYRFYVIVHDGDQNKSGGDCGQASFNYSYAGVVTASPATISGFALDQGGNPLAGVVITMRDSTGASIGTAATLADGSYQFTNVNAGNSYTLSASSTVINGTAYKPQSAAAGTVSGSTDGNNGIGTISGINLNGGDNGINYNFVLGPIA